jgi:multiple sugar transport system permease protein
MQLTAKDRKMTDAELRPAATLSMLRRATTPGNRSRRRAGQRRRERLAQWAFLAPAALYLVAFFGYPIIKNVVLGFQTYTTASLYTGHAPFAGLANYRAIFHSGLFGKLLLNTILFTLVSMVGQFVIGLALAIFFSNKFPLNSVIRALLLLPWLLPLVASGTVWRWMLGQDNGAVNKILEGGHLAPSAGVPWLVSVHAALIAVTIVNIWVGIPFNLVILYGGLQEIPTDLFEAAAIDGVGKVSRFRFITWPLLRPVVTVVVVLGFIYTVKVIDIILVVTGGGPAYASQTLAVEAYQLSFKTFLFGQGAAMGNLLIVTSMIFAVVYLRFTRHAIQEGNEE